MLYIQSLLDQWSFPATDPGVRTRWEQRLAEIGVAALHAELGRVDPAAAASILPTDGRRIVRALEVVELTGRPFAASAPRIGTPRWNTAIIGLDWDTAALDDRLARRTEQMFEAGLVDEVHALLDQGCARGSPQPGRWATRRSSPTSTPVETGRVHANRRSSAPAVTSAVNAPGSAATTASPGSTARRPTTSRQRCGHGGKYPEQVKFAKGHGTENDFVILVDEPADIALVPSAVAALCDRRRGWAPTACFASPRPVRCCRPVSSSACPTASPPKTGSWTTATPTGRRRRCAATGAGLRPLPVGGRAGAPPRVRGRLLAGPRPVELRAVDATFADVSVEMGKANQFGTGTAVVGGRTFTGLAVDVGNPHLACVDAALTADELASLDVAAPVRFDTDQFPDGVNIEVLTAAVDGVATMRVHERGVGETRSCGTGTVAAAVAALAHRGDATGALQVRIPGDRSPSRSPTPAVFCGVRPCSSRRRTRPGMVAGPADVKRGA